MNYKQSCLLRNSGIKRDLLDNMLAITKTVPFVAMKESAPTGFPELKNSAGIYLMFRNSSLLYVGYSNWLRFRLTGHAKGWLSLDPDMFPTHCEVLAFKDIDFAAEMESLLLQALKPPLNRTTKKFDRITDEQRGRAAMHVDTEDTFAEYGILDPETERFFGWYRCFDDTIDQYFNLIDAGNGCWRMVTPQQYDT